jgi:ribosomal protein S8
MGYIPIIVINFVAVPYWYWVILFTYVIGNTPNILLLTWIENDSDITWLLQLCCVLRENKNMSIVQLFSNLQFCFILFRYVLAGYIGEFTIIDDHRAGKIVVELIGRINKCGVISPRFDVTYYEMEQWITQLLPSRQFGHLVLTTTYGIMDHDECRNKRTGGKILGFFY